jgi:adenosylcobinamide kinase / adenosylcobinamide-phosphate guanylyltransferase
VKVQLLGTGSSDGLPNPFCTCRTCTHERAVGRQRANTCALIDDTVLCDWGPTTTAQAVRFGVDFARIGHVLITHGHPDHFAPQFLMWRSWIPDLPMLHVWGPAEVIDAARHWIGPDDPVELHSVHAGDQWTLDSISGVGPWHVQAIAAAHDTGNGDIHAEQALLYVITAPDGQRLFYATDTGPLPEETVRTLPSLDIVLMEETFGTHSEHQTGHLDLETFAQMVQTMRAGSVARPDTRIVAIHLGHHNPPTPELTERLAQIGAEVVDDGTVLGARPRHHLILGGTRSGKSTYAEFLHRHQPSVTYIATGYPPTDSDEEWAKRVERHRERRPQHWQVTETLDLVDAITTSRVPVLIDCLNLWVTRVIDETQAWSQPDIARAVIDDAVRALLQALDATDQPVTLVSNDVSTSLIPSNDAARLFQELLGEVNTQVAAHCDDVTMVIAGQQVVVKCD